MVVCVGKDEKSERTGEREKVAVWEGEKGLGE